MSLKRAVAARKRLARAGGTFVLTNGVFDLLHPGHASFLEAARRMAGSRGKLFVALNSDTSTRKLKGPRRPIMDEVSRAYTLAQLRSVDGIVIFRGRGSSGRSPPSGPTCTARRGTTRSRSWTLRSGRRS